MNIVYVCADRGVPIAGAKGASAHVRCITSAMQKRGHEVTVLARNTSGDNPFPEVGRVGTLCGDPSRAVEQILQAIAENGAHVVLERYSLDSGAARRASSASGIPLLLEVNAPLVWEAQTYRGLLDPEAAERERATLRSADRIQVVSPALLRWVRSVAPGIPSVCIPNGADLDSFRAAEPAPVDGLGPGPVVGFVGSMKPWHGARVLLEAFALARQKAPNASLLLIGGGPEEGQLRARAAAPDLASSVVFTGAVAHRAVPGLVKRMTVAVAPYLPQDEFYFQPLKVVEYLAAGVPVLYSDQGDLSAVVGPAGLGVAPGSVTELATRMSELLTDPQRLVDMAAAAPGMATRLGWDSVADQVVALASGN